MKKNSSKIEIKNQTEYNFTRAVYFKLFKNTPSYKDFKRRKSFFKMNKGRRRIGSGRGWKKTKARAKPEQIKKAAKYKRRGIFVIEEFKPSELIRIYCSSAARKQSPGIPIKQKHKIHQQPFPLVSFLPRITRFLPSNLLYPFYLPLASFDGYFASQLSSEATSTST